jgi:L-amino acid N-acyltransferase YncA
MVKIVPVEEKYFPQILLIWNEIVAEGLTFPWIEAFTPAQLRAKLRADETVGCAVDADDAVLGIFHVHPNNEGRCAHIANCGYMVRSAARGRGVGRMLVRESLVAARAEGFKGMQFNAVVSTNRAALALYQSEGFEIIGVVPGGFLLKSGEYVDLYIMFRSL